MPSTVPTHFVDEFSSSVRHLAQRKGSVLQDTCRVKNLTGNECTFEHLGTIEAVEITSRHEDTVIQERPHERRWVGSRDFAVHELYDWPDDYRTLVPLSSEYVKGQAYAISRKKDDLIVAAYSADAKSDRTGATTVSWTGVAYTGTNHTKGIKLKIDHDYDVMGKLASTGTGMSRIKLMAIKRIFDMRDIDPDTPRYVVMTPNQEQDLLLDDNLTTTERMNLKAYVAGEVPSFYGFQFKKTTALTVDGSSHRRCWAYTGNAMGCAVGREMFSRMEERADKNHALQISTYFASNAARLDEDEIIEVLCEETPATT